MFLTKLPFFNIFFSYSITYSWNLQFQQCPFTEDTHNGVLGTRAASYAEEELNSVLVRVPVPDREIKEETAVDWELENKQELATYKRVQVNCSFFLEHPRFYKKVQTKHKKERRRTDVSYIMFKCSLQAFVIQEMSFCNFRNAGSRRILTMELVGLV